MNEIVQLIENQRGECLWSYKKDYYPKTNDQCIKILQIIKQHCSSKIFYQADKLQKLIKE